MHRAPSALMLGAWLALLPNVSRVAEPGNRPHDTSRGDAMVAEYFRAETQRLTDACLADVKTKEDWLQRRDRYRLELQEMLSLVPEPARSPLSPVVTGTLEHPEFVVEKLQFHSMPGLFVTGNLYRPTKPQGKLPAVLYVCGHGGEKKDGVSFGNKTHYRHHGGWFARNGYVCLTIDTVQLGEIEGVHHGTYKEGMWWWNSRGYTPAGVEAWNGIRALDYLETRADVDKQRLGVTGRSGGGAYSWWIAALDERIKVAVPVAGITSLKNHVVDGCVEGHCDCMYPVNTYEWDYPQIAALVSPRPLLIANTDKDRIFPLDGVVDVYDKTRRIYELQGARDKIGLQISEGPHVDSQELQVAALRWFNRHLKGNDTLIETAAKPVFSQPELRVFAELPKEQRNATIHETFVPRAVNEPAPDSAQEWSRRCAGWMMALKKKCFAGWPAEYDSVNRATPRPLGNSADQTLKLECFHFDSQPNVTLCLHVVRPAAMESPVSDVVLEVLDDAGWRRFVATFGQLGGAMFANAEPVEHDPAALARFRKDMTAKPAVYAFFAPRGIGTTEWTRDVAERKHIRRRFMLLGQTMDGMRVWDVRQALSGLRLLFGSLRKPIVVRGQNDTACIALYASLFEPDIARLELRRLPGSHQKGPDLLNVLRFLDIPQAVAMAAERAPVVLQEADAADWKFPIETAKNLGWGADRVRVVP